MESVVRDDIISDGSFMVVRKSTLGIPLRPAHRCSTIVKFCHWWSETCFFLSQNIPLAGDISIILSTCIPHRYGPHCYYLCFIIYQIAKWIEIPYIFHNLLDLGDVIHETLWCNIGADDGLLPDSSKPLSELMFSYHQKHDIYISIYCIKKINNESKWTLS